MVKRRTQSTAFLLLTNPETLSCTSNSLFSTFQKSHSALWAADKNGKSSLNQHLNDESEYSCLKLKIAPKGCAIGVISNTSQKYTQHFVLSVCSTAVSHIWNYSSVTLIVIEDDSNVALGKSQCLINYHWLTALDYYPVFFICIHSSRSVFQLSAFTPLHLLQTHTYIHTQNYTYIQMAIMIQETMCYRVLYKIGTLWKEQKHKKTVSNA